MRIFVGTLYSGENEFEECLDSIRGQRYSNYQHFVYKYLPNKEAHVTLFKTFLEKAHDFDVLIKVDADMVLVNNEVFDNIVQRMNENDDIEIFAIAVQDFFSNELIWGLNAYRNTVRWDFEKETMFVDIPEVSRDKILYDDNELAPAAIHCKNPSPYQAFHYGAHRGLKSLQTIHSATHWDLLAKTWKNFQKTRDVRVGLAVLGAELAYTGLFKFSDLDYTNSRLKDILERYLSFDARELECEIKRMRLKNWGIFPSNTRRKLLRLLYGKGTMNE